MGSSLFSKKDKNKNLKDTEQNTIESLSDPILVVYPILSDIINISISNYDENQDGLSSDSSHINSAPQSLIDSEISQVEEMQSGRNKKKKKKGFFLYSTQKKKKDSNSHSQLHKSFIAKLNSDIIKYNDYTTQILSLLQPIKEYIISKIKLQISDALREYYHFDLEIYGSFKSDLAIESSDIDIMFNPLRQKINTSEIILTLSNYFNSLNLYEKIIPIYTASVPLIKLFVIPEYFLCENDREIQILSTYLSLKKSQLYLYYQYDKSELDEIKVDITFPIKGNKSNEKNIPRLQVEFIKSTLYEHSVLKPIVKILKRILKIKNLNNSYKGGLSSYSLFLLVFAFLKHFHFDKGGKYNGSNIFSNFMVELIKWYSSFQFYYMMVDASKDYPYIQYASFPQEGYGAPTIIDPVTMLNAGKSSFNIINVKVLFGNLVKIIEDIKTHYENGDKEVMDSNIILDIFREVAM